MNQLLDKIHGSLLGGMIGDAMGAPGEGLTYGEIQDKYGPEGLTDFRGLGTDDTAVKHQLLSAIFKSEGYPNVDAFAQSFIDYRDQNYRLWFISVKNAFHKFSEGLSVPAYAGWGNMQSSSTAMAISPMGIINAGNPRQASLETQEIASLIHNGPTGFCRDAACVIAAAVAAAFKPGITMEEVIETSYKHLAPLSSKLLLELISNALALAKKEGTYEKFRQSYYESSLRPVLCDSRETLPATLAILYLSNGSPRKAITYAANFGRDADTIGAMVCGIVGALHGVSGLPQEWVEKASNVSTSETDYSKPQYGTGDKPLDLTGFNYVDIAKQLQGVIQRRQEDLGEVSEMLTNMNQ